MSPWWVDRLPRKIWRRWVVKMNWREDRLRAFTFRGANRLGARAWAAEEARHERERS